MLGRFALHFPLPLLKSLVLTASSKIGLIREITEFELFWFRNFHSPSSPPASEVSRPHRFLKGLSNLGNH